jgi:hypothetical protein
MALPRGDHATQSSVSANGPRHWWLGAIGAVAAIFGLVRLLLDVTTTVLGTSESCGNAIGWLGHGSALDACGAPLHNASLEGVGTMVVGAALLLAWLVAVVPGHWTFVAMVVILVLVFGAFAEYLLIAVIIAAGLISGYGLWRAYRHRGRADTRAIDRLGSDAER